MLKKTGDISFFTETIDLLIQETTRPIQTTKLFIVLVLHSIENESFSIFSCIMPVFSASKQKINLKGYDFLGVAKTHFKCSFCF